MSFHSSSTAVANEPGVQVSHPTHFRTDLVFRPRRLARGANEWRGQKSTWGENPALSPAGSLVAGAEVKMDWTQLDRHSEMCAAQKCLQMGHCPARRPRVPFLASEPSSLLWEALPIPLPLPCHPTTYPIPQPTLLEPPGLTPSETHPPLKTFSACLSVDPMWISSGQCLSWPTLPPKKNPPKTKKQGSSIHSIVEFG